MSPPNFPGLSPAHHTLVKRPNGPPIDHFGLAARDYTPSTTPNRRFAALITQRLVKATLAGVKPAYFLKELDELATYCTAQDDAAQKIERQARKSEAELLRHSRTRQVFDGLVTGTGSNGTWVRIFQPRVEGRISGALPLLKVGQVLKVKLASTSVERAFIDFARAH